MKEKTSKKHGKYVRSIWKFIKKYFCYGKEKSNQKSILDYKLKKEQYMTFVAIMVMVILLYIILTIMGYIPLFLLMTKIITVSGCLCLLYFRLINLAIIIFFMRGLISAMASISNADLAQNFLLSQFYLIILPIICIILSRCIKMTAICYLISITLSMYIYLGKYPFKHVQHHIPNGFPSFMYTGMISSVIFSLVIWRLMESRNNLLIQLDEKKIFLEQLNKELTNKNQELKESLQAKDTFLLSVSHELRNPLNIIMGSAELAILDERTFPKVYLENIRSSAELLELFINNLLDSAKMEKVNLELCYVKVDMVQFFERIWNTSRILINKKSLKGKLFIHHNIPRFLHLDTIRVIQVVYNLVGNAVKFTRSGYISIICTWVSEQNLELDAIATPTEEYTFREISEVYLRNTSNSIESDPRNQSINQSYQKSFVTLNNENLNFQSINSMDFRLIQTLRSKDISSKYHQFDNNQSAKIANSSFKNIPNTLNESYAGYLKIEVIDSGPGINQNFICDLFKKFSQIGPNSHKQLGTGLGLWISHNLCKNMKGTLKAFSKEGVGSIFVALFKSSTDNKIR